MAKLRIQGDSTGYVDLEAPTNASSSTLDLDQVPQLNQNTTFSKDSPELTIQGTTTQAHLRLESVANNSSWLISNESNGNRMRIMHTDTSTSTNSFPMYLYEAGYVTTPSQPAFHAFSAVGDNISITSGSQTAVILSGIKDGLNVGNHYSTSTGRFTAPISGTYFFSAAASYVGTFSAARTITYIRKNGSQSQGINIQASRSNGLDTGGATSGVIYLAAGDYVDFATYQDSGSTRSLIGNGDSGWTYLTGYLIG